MKKLLLVILSLAANLFSQIYNFHYYNSGNGLTNTSITCITQDKQGYIWIGTTSSVFKYDGYKIQEVTLLGNELKSEIVGLAEFNDQMWIATSTRGIFIIKRNKEIVNLNDRLLNLPKKIRVIRKFDDKLLLISQSNEFYVAQSDSQISKILVDALLPQTQFNDIAKIEGGYAIASDDGLIIFQYNRVKYKFNQNKSGKTIQAKAIALDKDKNVLFLSSNGSLYKIENYNLVEIFSSNANYTRYAVLVDQSNSIWAGVDDGIIRIENKKEQLIGFANGLPHQVVTALFEDREGNIWIGTLNGVAKLNSLAIKNYPSLFPKVTSSIYKIFKSGRDIYIFTDEGISVFNLNGGKIINYPFNFSNQNNVNDVIDYADNTKIVGTNNGLYIWQGSRLSQSPLNSLINSKRILSLAKGSNNKIYVGTDSGLFAFQGNKLIDYLSVDNLLPSNEINSILVTKSEDVWLGTENGLVKYEEDNLLVLRTGNGLANNFVTSLSEDGDGKIWIGTKKGLSSFKNGRFNNFFPKILGSMVDEITDVIPVRLNEIWAGTPRGIFIIKNGIEFSWLTSADGLLSDFITDIEYDQQNGVVFVGTNSGLTTIELKYLRQKNFSYKIFFTEFLTDKKNYDLSQIKVSEDETDIRIRVSIFSFFDEKKIIYRYRLKELEDSWNYLTGSNEIKYQNLEPGKYTLIVEASIDGVKWLKNSAELKFEVQSGFFKNLLFYGSILIGLVFAYSLVIFIKNSIRSRRLVKQETTLDNYDNISLRGEPSKLSSNPEKSETKEITDLNRKRFEEKIESLTKLILEKEKIIEDLRDENNLLKDRLLELEKSLSSKLDENEEESEFVEKSRIEIIVKNSNEAEEIKRYIDALEKTNWSIRAAAKLLNIPHSTFHYRLKKLNLLKNK